MPLPYQPENNDIPVQTPPSVALDALRTIAVSRFYLSNFDHLVGWPGRLPCNGHRRNKRS